MKTINSAEYRDNRVLIQVMSKAEVERVITKENETRFKLAYSSPTLKSDMHMDLGLSGDRPLTREIIGSQRQLEESLGAQEIFDLFRNSKHDRTSSIILVEQ